MKLCAFSENAELCKTLNRLALCIFLEYSEGLFQSDIISYIRLTFVAISDFEKFAFM
jgi:hypothetical protein